MIIEERRLRVERRRAPHEALHQQPYRNMRRSDERTYTPAHSAGRFTSSGESSASGARFRSGHASTPVRSSMGSRTTQSNSGPRNNHHVMHSREPSSDLPYNRRGNPFHSGGRPGFVQHVREPEHREQVLTAAAFNRWQNGNQASPSRPFQGHRPMPRPSVQSMMPPPPPPPAINQYPAPGGIVPTPQHEVRPIDVSPMHYGGGPYVYAGPAAVQYSPYHPLAQMPPMTAAM